MSSGSRTKRKVIHFPMLRSYLSYCLRSRHGQFLWELPFQVSHVPGQGEVCKGGRIFWNLHSCQRCRLGASWTRRLLSIPTNGRTPPDMWCTRLSMYQGKAPNILHDQFAQKKFDCKIGRKIDHFISGKTIPLDRNPLWNHPMYKLRKQRCSHFLWKSQQECSILHLRWSRKCCQGHGSLWQEDQKDTQTGETTRRWGFKYYYRWLLSDQTSSCSLFFFFDGLQSEEEKIKFKQGLKLQ